MFEEKVKEQNTYCNIDVWHEAGYTGKDIPMWNCEPIDSNSEMHGQDTTDRVDDVAYDSIIVNAGITGKSGSDYYDVRIPYNGKDYELEEFIIYMKSLGRPDVPLILNRSIGGDFASNWTFKGQVWAELMEKYNIIMFNSMGNDGGDDGGNQGDDLAYRVGACTLDKQGDLFKLHYSTTGNDLDFVSFTGGLSGTSFSSPYVAGMAVLLADRYGNITREGIYQYLIDHCQDDSNEDGWDKKYGYGLPIMGDPSEEWKYGRTEIMDYFKDDNGHWGESAINECASVGIFKGDDEGLIHPDRAVTTAQLAQILVNAGVVDAIRAGKI